MEIFIKKLMMILFFCSQMSLSLAVCQAFFTPQDNLTELFITMIDEEKKSILGAMYTFTDKKIAQAMINAKKRGVEVLLILDQISMASCGKGKFLQENGVPVVVHRTQEFNPYTTALMHHKFFIFGCNRGEKSYLWTGSWNCTLRATKYNDENVLILDEPAIIVQYIDNFYRMHHKLLGDVA